MNWQRAARLRSNHIASTRHHLVTVRSPAPTNAGRARTAYILGPASSPSIPRPRRRRALSTSGSAPARGLGLAGLRTARLAVWCAGVGAGLAALTESAMGRGACEIGATPHPSPSQIFGRPPGVGAAGDRCRSGGRRPRGLSAPDAPRIGVVGSKPAEWRGCITPPKWGQHRQRGYGVARRSARGTET